MSRAQRRWSQVRLVPRMAIVGPAAVLVIAAGLAVAGIEMALRSLPATLASLVRGSSSRRLR